MPDPSSVQGGVPQGDPERHESVSTPHGTRRSLYAWVVGLASTVIGLSLLGPLAIYVSAPAFRREKDSWSEVGSIGDLPVGKPEELTFADTVTDGWRTITRKHAVWVVKQGEGDLKVFSPICPHLGCAYRWNPSDQHFECPCHGSVYSLTGKVLGGPAPRPLDTLPFKTKNGDLWVIYKQFKSGLERKVEM